MFTGGNTKDCTDDHSYKNLQCQAVLELLQHCFYLSNIFWETSLIQIFSGLLKLLCLPYSGMFYCCRI